jgi:hypothetical protein
MTPLPPGLACVAGAAEDAGHNVRLLTLGTEADCENDIRRATSQRSKSEIPAETESANLRLRPINGIYCKNPDGWSEQ